MPNQEKVEGIKDELRQRFASSLKELPWRDAEAIVELIDALVDAKLL